MRKSQYKIYTSSQAAWDAMHYAIANAQSSIYWELYIFVDDDAGRTFFDTLQKKSKAGVDVKLIMDWFGSISVSRARIDSLKKSGVDVHFFQQRKYILTVLFDNRKLQIKCGKFNNSFKPLEVQIYCQNIK